VPLVTLLDKGDVPVREHHQSQESCQGTIETYFTLHTRLRFDVRLVPIRRYTSNLVVYEA